ncbi:MAG: glycosyltransferase family 39 protein [Candidatus Omnitrophota bacterium]
MLLRDTKWYFWIWALIFISAAALRAYVFFQGPALWIDEGLTANKLIFLPLRLIIRPDGDSYELMQFYPVGFLALSKAVIRVLGVSETSLRLIPFLSGILSLIIFGRLAQRLFRPPWDLLALVLFGFSYPLIHHSVELKPYSSDVLVAVILFLIALTVIEKPRRFDILLLSLAGIVSLLVSFTSVFIIFPLLVLWIFQAFWQKNSSALIARLFVFLVFLSSQIIYFQYSLRHFLEYPRLMKFWESGFININNSLSSSLQLVWQNIQNLFPSIIWPVLMLIGIFSLRRRPDLMLICLIPMIAVLSAAGLHFYPIAPRTILFLMPFFVILTVSGCQSLFIQKFPVRLFIAVPVIGILLWTSFIKITPFASKFSFGEDIRPLVCFLNENRKEGEPIYVNDMAISLFIFYHKLFKPGDSYLKKIRGLIGSDLRTHEGKKGIFLDFTPFAPGQSPGFISDSGDFYAPLENPDNIIRRGRNWFLMAHTKPCKKVLFDFLEKNGERLLVMKSDRDATLYLYDIQGAQNKFVNSQDNAPPATE